MQELILSILKGQTGISPMLVSTQLLTSVIVMQ
jgi:hypothetical protein